jgi:hypothetical protein
VISAAGPVAAGILLPEPFLYTDWFAVVAAFVAVNTVMYAALAVAKILPKLRLPDWRRGQRSESRSIYPNGRPPSQRSKAADTEPRGS